MKEFFFAFLFFTVFAELAFAQVVDMRAFSRQRGFRAYRPSVAPEAVRPAERPNASRQNAEQAVQTDMAASSDYMASLNQTEKEPRQIQQKGLKIFQEKDENKVLNFNVDNPEFKKLNKQQQQDLLNRIKFE